MTKLRKLTDKKVWAMMNQNRYTYICIGGILLFIAQFVFPTMLEPIDPRAGNIGTFLYNGIAVGIAIVSGFGGWAACSDTISRMEEIEKQEAEKKARGANHE